ncbi:MAG: FAD-dependent oxidoreductase [Oscillospiraceae bacterium]|nr:FAD-dependent oxidoreductase [Oscillospiraceae bacterium]
MSRLEVKTPGKAQAVVEQLYRNMERRIAASPPGLCPVDMALSFLQLCQAQTCGKCAPCRIGLGQLANMMEEVLDGEPGIGILRRIEHTAQVIADTADCAIGIDAANLVLMGLKGFRDDYEEHILHHRCLGSLRNPVPCVALCPAGVDIPGYIALVNEGRCDDAVRLIRKDNPFPVACAYICEHPCEARCRRNMVDDAVNIRGLKRYAVDHAEDVPQPQPAAPTGRRVAVIGGGPGGLSAAYYLALMGHSVTVYEKQKHLGGMMRYGIPSYRLPRQKLDEEIASILSLGIQVRTGVDVGTDITFEELKRDYDSLYLSIGAQTDKKTGIEGEDSPGVISAVELLRHIGDDELPDFSGQNVAVIGGGNVAMDVTRSAIRLGAAKVTCVYRRRQEDMTAQPEEVEGAIAEGAEILTLQAPLRVEVGEDGRAAALWTQPQIIGEVDTQGRPRPNTASAEPVRIPADVVIVAIGQGIESMGFEQAGVKIQRGGKLMANSSTQLPDMQGVFAGGDCVTGPATVIRAIAAGKAAAANIDEYLGFRHEIHAEVKVPAPRCADPRPRGRVEPTERDAGERKNDFLCIECPMTGEEAAQESSRCLRCDHFGYGNFKGGRIEKW